MNSEMKAYVYSLYCIVKDGRFGYKISEIEWDKECEIAYCDIDNGTYEIPNTAYKGDYYNMNDYRIIYDKSDGYGSICVELITLDSNYMEFFKEEAVKRALEYLIVELDKERNKNEIG